MVHKTSMVLADQRELIYFDDTAGQVRVLQDSRHLPERASGSELRHDPLLDEWIAIASHRQSRTFLPPTDQCPLCPSTPENPSEIPGPYDVAVFENRFPSLSMTAPPPQPQDWDEPLFERRAGLGRCEVVVFTSDHDKTFSQVSPQRARTIIEAWVDRTSALREMSPIREVYCFENRGEAIGVTLSHPHGQIYGYPYITPRTRKILDAADRYHTRTGRRLQDDIVDAEVAAKVRIVDESEHWLAFVPAAARWPIELHLYSKRPVGDLPSLDDDERADLADFYLRQLKRVEGLYEVEVPYISGWRQAPVGEEFSQLRLHLQLFSTRRAANKLKFLAGSESGSDAFIADVTAEAIAASLRASVR